MTLNWRAKFGTVALAICFIELIVIWGGTAVALNSPQYDWRWLEKPLSDVYVFGMVSIPLAIVGLFKDCPRRAALGALVFGLANLAICSLPFSV